MALTTYLNPKENELGCAVCEKKKIHKNMFVIDACDPVKWVFVCGNCVQEIVAEHLVLTEIVPL